MVAAPTYFIVLEDEVLARFGDDRTKVYLEGLMAHEPFGHDVLDGFPVSRCAAEQARRHATNLIGAGAAFPIEFMGEHPVGWRPRILRGPIDNVWDPGGPN